MHKFKKFFIEFDTKTPELNLSLKYILQEEGKWLLKDSLRNKNEWLAKTMINTVADVHYVDLPKWELYFQELPSLHGSKLVWVMRLILQEI